MKNLSSSIALEQKKVSVLPAVKIGIRSFDYPDEKHSTSYRQFDKDPVWESASATGMRGCCASDGSIVFLKGGTAYRFASPSPSTDFTSIAASGTPAGFTNEELYDIAADPNSAEVIIVHVTGNYIEAKVSSDYGATFGSYSTISPQFWYGNPSSNFTDPDFVRASYNDDGDIFLIAGQKEPVLVQDESGVSYGTGINMLYIQRIDGTWDTSWNEAQIREDDYDILSDFFSLRWYGSYSSGNYFGFTYYTNLMMLKNIEVCYDGVWFVTYDIYQDNSEPNPLPSGCTGYLEKKTSYKWGIFYGSCTDGGTYTYGGQTDMTDSNLIATSITSMSRIGGSATSRRDMPGGLENFTDLKGWHQTYIALGNKLSLLNISCNQDNSWIEVAYPYSYLTKISNMPIVMSFYDNGKCHFIAQHENYDVDDGIFKEALAITTDYPIALTHNSTYLFGYNGNQIFVWPIPYPWEEPTAGSGAGGTEYSMTTDVLGIKASCYGTIAGRMEVTLDNSASTYDSPGTGDLAGLARGSRVSLYLGFNINGVDTTSELQRYFIDSWYYGRNTNLATFTLVCIDAWGMLDNYKFGRRVRFNYLGAATTYSVYEMIETLVNTIGGTLSYSSRSTDITSIYPRIELEAGSTAGNLMRRLLILVPDTIVWYGNDATIVYPQDDDSAVYSYKSN